MGIKPKETRRRNSFKDLLQNFSTVALNNLDMRTVTKSFLGPRKKSCVQFDGVDSFEAVSDGSNHFSFVGACLNKRLEVVFLLNRPDNLLFLGVRRGREETSGHHLWNYADCQQRQVPNALQLLRQ